MRRAPVDHVDDAAVERGGLEFFAAALAIQADAEFGARLRIENQPALFLAAREARAARGFVVGMDLDRQPFRGEEEFDHDRRFVAGGVGEPNLSDAAAAEDTAIRGDVGAAPRFFTDDGSVARRVGKEGGSSGRPRGAAYPEKRNRKKK